MTTYHHFTELERMGLISSRSKIISLSFTTSSINDALCKRLSGTETPKSFPHLFFIGELDKFCLFISSLLSYSQVISPLSHLQQESHDYHFVIAYLLKHQSGTTKATGNIKKATYLDISPRLGDQKNAKGSKCSRMDEKKLSYRRSKNRRRGSKVR